MSKPKPIVLTQRDRALNQVRVALAASVALLVLGLLALALIFGDRTGDLERELASVNADRAQVKADLRDTRAVANEANSRLVEVGEKPVTAPVIGPQGTPGADGRPPTPGEIRDAVSAYCSSGACQGPAGRNVTQAQVAAAVVTFCNARGECRGAQGGAGADGGPGPPPTTEQIAAAVAAFCADGHCRGEVGPPGPQGAAGTPGADGVGIGDVELRPTATPTECDLIVTFTDGTTTNAGQVTCPVAGQSGPG